VDAQKKGKLILRNVTGLGGEAILVSMLRRVYPSVSPDLLLTMFSKPKPYVLIRDISEANAANLIKMLQTQGTDLVFVPTVEQNRVPEPLPPASTYGPRETRAVARILNSTPPSLAGHHT